MRSARISTLTFLRPGRERVRGDSSRAEVRLTRLRPVDEHCSYQRGRRSAGRSRFEFRLARVSSADEDCLNSNSNLACISPLRTFFVSCSKCGKRDYSNSLSIVILGSDISPASTDSSIQLTGVELRYLTLYNEETSTQPWHSRNRTTAHASRGLCSKMRGTIRSPKGGTQTT